MKYGVYETMMGAMAKRGPKGPMTDEHKAALAMGRNEGNAVRNYLVTSGGLPRDRIIRS